MPRKGRDKRQKHDRSPSTSQNSVVSTTSNLSELSVGEWEHSPLTTNINNKTKAVSSQPKSPPESKEKKSTYRTLSNFSAGFQGSAVEQSEQKSPPPPITSPKTARSDSEDTIIIDIDSPPSDTNDLKAPLLNSLTTSYTDIDSKTIIDIKPTTTRPTTTIEILHLTPEEIKAIFTEVTEEAKVSPSAKKYLMFLFCITLAAVFTEPSFSLWLQQGIKDNLEYLFTKGKTILLNNTAAVCSLIFSWSLAVFNVMVDMLAVNPTEEAYKIFKTIMEWLKQTRDCSGQRMFHALLVAGVFLPAGAFISCAAVNGLRKTSPDGVYIATASIVEFLQMVYFTMFNYSQFAKGLGALGNLSLSLGNYSLSCCSSKSPTPQILTAEKKAKKKEKASRLEKLQDAAIYLEIFKVLMSIYLFRLLSHFTPFLQTLNNQFNMSDGPVKKGLLIWAGSTSLLVAILCRTLSTISKTFNAEFDQLTPREIREADIGKLEHFINISIATISGTSIFGLAYNPGPDDQIYSAALAAGPAVLSTLITYGASHRSSKRAAALEAKKQKQEINLSDNLFTNAEDLYLHQILVMNPEEIFDEVIKKTKTNISWIKLTDYLNFLARTSRIMVTGNLINEMVALFASNGMNLSIDYIDQLSLTLYFFAPMQWVGDRRAFGLELHGGPNDAEGHIPYLLAKYKITGARGFISHLATPKAHFDFLPIFKALCKLDEKLSDAFAAIKTTIKKSGGDNISDDTLILSLRKHIKEEYNHTIERLAQWVNQPSEKRHLKELQHKHPEFTSYIKKLRSSKGSTNAQDFGFTGKDYLILKDLENRLFQSKMHSLLDSEWAATNDKSEDRAMIDEYKKFEYNKYPISLEALDLVKRYEATLSPDKNEEKEKETPSTNQNSWFSRAKRVTSDSYQSVSVSINDSSAAATEEEEDDYREIEDEDLENPPDKDSEKNDDDDKDKAENSWTGWIAQKLGYS